MYIIIITAVILLLLLFVPIRAVIEKKEGLDFYIKVFIFKIRPKKKKKKEKRLNPKKHRKKTPVFQIIKNIHAKKEGIFNFVEYIKDRNITVEKLEFNMEFGTGDAADTGIATGILNGILYNAVGILHNNTTIKKWRLNITPDFEKEKLNLSFSCIVKTRLLHIIGVANHFLILYKSLKKNNLEG